MALQVRVTSGESCDGILVKDITSTYDAVSNPTGYGAPNPSFGQVIPYTAAVTLPNGTTSVFTLDLLADPPAPVVVCSCSGVDVSTYTWTITPADLGLTEITPGVYTIQWSAGDQNNVIGGTPQTGVSYLLATRELQADIDNLILTAFQGCDEAEQDRALALQGKLCAAMKAHGCARYAQAQAMIDSIVLELSQCC